MDAVDRIDRLAALRNEEYVSLIYKKEELPGKIEAAEAKVAEAINTGNKAEFEAAVRERDSLKLDEDFVTRRISLLDSSPDVDPDAVAAAWEEYRASFDPKLEKKLAAFRKAKRAMLDAYKEMVELQEEASRIRTRFADYAGAELPGYGAPELHVRYPSAMIPMLTYADGSGLLSMGGTTLKDPDAVYYLSNYVRDESGKNPVYSFVDDKRLYALNGILAKGVIPE